MDGFLLETLNATGWKLGGDTHWTLDAAKSRAARIVEKNHAKRVRILPVTVSDAAIAEYPNEPEPAFIADFRRIANDESTLPHVRDALTAALAAYDARRANHA